jgi:hypothetical protein
MLWFLQTVYRDPRWLCTTSEFPCDARLRPNKSLQPTPTAVTPPAAQEIVPAVDVAEH